MRKSKIVNLPVAILWGFREFKRDEVPAPQIAFVAGYNVDEVTDYVEAQGIAEPLELSIMGSRALLTDGNHRIVAAKRLGYTMVPVKVTVFFGEGMEPFFKQTMARFKPMSRHLELWLNRIFVGEMQIAERNDKKNFRMRRSN